MHRGIRRAQLVIGTMTWLAAALGHGVGISSFQAADGGWHMGTLAVGQLDGDGQEEIVIGTYNPTNNPSDGTLYVFGLDGTLKFSVPVPGGLKHIPALANVYGNGIDVVYRSLAGRVYIQNFGSTSSGPVSWSTHRGNSHRDGNLGVSLFPPGTPLTTHKESGYRRASFSWGGPATNSARCWRVYRAEQPEGPITHVVTLTAGATSYTDDLLKPGCQYIYEVAAVYDTNTVHSAPFAVLSLLNSNLVANAGFEENDNSHWDKWYTGDIECTNMTASTNTAFQGGKSIQIKLVNKGNNGSVSQYSQYGTPDAYLPVVPGTLYSFGCFFKSGGISKSPEHWIEWGSTKTGENTNNRPTRPYPLYFTPHFVIGTSATDWTYANRTFVLPSGFPNVNLAHWYTIASPGSGSIYLDNVFFRALPSPGSTNWTELSPFHSTWRYFCSSPPPDWFGPDFDNASWPVGTAKFGAGSGPTNIVTVLPPQKPAYCFRRNFVAPSMPLQELLLSATCTDGGANFPEVYLNGTRLATSGIDAVSGQGNQMEYYDLTPFIDLLRPGTNTLAVVLNDVWQPTWDDVAFDVDLKAVMTSTPVLPSLSVLNPAGQAVNLNISVPINTVWRVESADRLSSGRQLVDVITNLLGNDLILLDTGQNDRLPPSQTSTRLYRLVPN